MLPPNSFKQLQQRHCKEIQRGKKQSAKAKSDTVLIFFSGLEWRSSAGSSLMSHSKELGCARLCLFSLGMS